VESVVHGPRFWSISAERRGDVATKPESAKENNVFILVIRLAFPEVWLWVVCKRLGDETSQENHRGRCRGVENVGSWALFLQKATMLHVQRPCKWQLWCKKRQIFSIILSSHLKKDLFFICVSVCGVAKPTTWSWRRRNCKQEWPTQPTVTSWNEYLKAHRENWKSQRWRHSLFP